MGLAAATAALEDDFLALVLAHLDRPRDADSAWSGEAGERLLACRVPLRDLAAIHGATLRRLLAERPGADPAAAVEAGGRVMERLLSLYDAEARRKQDELQQIETDLRQRETFLRTVIEAAPAAINIRDRQDRFVLVNKLLADTFGSTPAEMVSTDFAEHHPRGYEDLEGADDNRRVVETGRPVYGLEGTYLVDGRREVWLSSKAPILNDAGEVDFVTTVAIDITERVEAEQALRQSELYFQSIVEGHPLPVWMVDVESGEILYESPAAAKLLGLDWPAKETRSAASYYAKQSDRLVFLRRLRDRGEVHDLELQAKKADGTVFWVSLTSRLVRYQGRDVAITSIIDLTERRAFQEELAHQREALHQSEKLSALGELLAGVAHELNNPLSVVVGQALLLTETADDAKTEARARKIGKAADRCARIVKTFLAMARQQPVESRAMELNETIEAALDVTAYALRASDVEVSLDLAEGLPPVWADPDQIGQVMTNLIVNARHALEEIEPPRRLRIASFHRPVSDEVVIEVEDNGPGVPEAIRGRIFEPLFTTKDVSSGTGIGLTLCHRIVAAHGGRIGLESGAGKSSVFVIWLPAMRPDQGRTVASAGELPGAAALSVLVIDDEVEVAEILSEILEVEGHEVAVANSGEAALERLAKSHYDIVLSDLRMPGLDGPRLFEIFEDERPDLVSRTAFITGDSLSPGIQAFLDEVGRPFIEKPITPDEVRGLIREMTET